MREVRTVEYPDDPVNYEIVERCASAEGAAAVTEFESVMEKVRSDIERVGWSAIGVFPTDQLGGSTFTYTIGVLTSYKHPELIVYGLPNHQAHAIISSAIAQIKEGVFFKPGERYENVLEGFDVKTRAVDPSGRPLNVARAYYDVDHLVAVQILWPCTNGHFPGDEYVDPLVELVQVPSIEDVS